MAFAMQGLFGEKSPSKVAGLFGQREEAERAARELTGMVGLRTTQLRVLGPDDATLAHNELFARAVEPESRGIFRTILRTHAVTGVVGAVVGVLLFAWAYFSGQAMVVASPLLAFIAFTGSPPPSSDAGRLLSCAPTRGWIKSCAPR